MTCHDVALDRAKTPVQPVEADREAFVAAMARAATGISVVTTDGPAGRFALTVSAVSSVSADPPMVLACVNRKSPLSDSATANGVFCINLLATRHEEVSNVFAGRPDAGPAFDFGCADWTEGLTGAPVLADALASFECRLADWHDAGSHRILIGTVMAARQGEGDPLVYAGRGYRHIAAPAETVINRGAEQ